MVEAELYEANDALAECRAMWLHLGRHMRDLVVQCEEWPDDESSAVMAMTMLAQAEACFWRATGDDEPAHVAHWIPAMRALPPQTKETGDAE